MHTTSQIYELGKKFGRAHGVLEIVQRWAKEMAIPFGKFEDALKEAERLQDEAFEYAKQIGIYPWGIEIHDENRGTSNSGISEEGK